tara:strand:- start:7298 stop:7681 length:384 start_codon:yes stop_codon:yes gene_type:complete
MFDLAQLDSRAFAEEGVEVDILHRETGEKTGIKIRVQGADSMAYKNAMLDSARNAKKDQTAEDACMIGAKIVAKITLGWSGLAADGEEIEFSYDNAVDMYYRFDWVANQVLAAVNDSSRFLVNAKAS